MSSAIRAEPRGFLLPQQESKPRPRSRCCRPRPTTMMNYNFSDFILSHLLTGSRVSRTPLVIAGPGSRDLLLTPAIPRVVAADKQEN